MMGSLFIIGNGFDMAHGIPTSYSKFRSFVIDKYPEALKRSDEVVHLEDLKAIKPDAFAAEILLSAMDKAAGVNWSNFEEALADINFDVKLPAANHKEHETFEEDCRLMQKYMVYMDVLTNKFTNCTKIWQEFFRLWIKSIEVQIEDGEFAPKDSLKTLFSQPEVKFLTFNYTKTLQELYGIKKVIHIHNRVGQKLIFGHGEKDAVYGRNSDKAPNGSFVSSSSLDEMVMSFRKDTEKPMKKYRDFFEKLDGTIDKVYSYGFSYGKVDSVYIKKIIEKISPDAVWYFTSFEAQNSKELGVKKVKLRRYGFKGTFDIYDGS